MIRKLLFLMAGISFKPGFDRRSSILVWAGDLAELMMRKISGLYFFKRESGSQELGIEEESKDIPPERRIISAVKSLAVRPKNSFS